ncbi:inositol monophosphatase family protein [Rathayibacter soli]|uniref:inositol monophosphatase family protein n=1 Tax=Rathayibacter soli TaxID=3144168 RepID=UPI0027E44EDA|nr:inositol monophosphatase [Glaciibacter superstes]
MNIQEESRSLRGVATTAARSVRDQLLAAFRTTMRLDFKRDVHDIVTVHDKASERQIVSVILSEVPDSTIIGEEGGKIGTGRVIWYIDPIDGTSNFARGIALWCVSIAAVIDDRVVAGVVFNPVSGDLFSADLTGAWLGGRRLHALAAENELSATIVSSFPNARDLQLFDAAALEAHGTLLVGFQAVRNFGSAALCLAHVAAGWADATMGFSTSPWDVAAGILILEQSGGNYLGYSRGAIDSPAFLAPDFIAVGGGGTRYPTLLGVVEELSGSYDAR